MIYKYDINIHRHIYIYIILYRNYKIIDSYNNDIKV